MYAYSAEQQLVSVFIKFQAKKIRKERSNQVQVQNMRYAEINRDNQLSIISISIVLSLLAIIPALTQEQTKADNLVFFFTIDLNDEETLEFQDNIVPNIPDNVCYGWRLKLNDRESLVQYTEEFILPSEPATWEAESDPYATSTITKGRTTSITKEFAAPKDGWISNHWCIAEGDPNGPYTMKISVADKPMGEVNFEVVPVDEFKKHSNLNSYQKHLEK